MSLGRHWNRCFRRNSTGKGTLLLMRPPLLQIELNISSAVSNKIAAVCPACENLLFASTESRQIWWGFPHPLLGPLQQACNRGPGFLNPILGITNVKRSTCRPLVCSYFYIFLGSNAHKVSMLSPKHSQSLLYFVPQSSKVRHQLPKQIQLQLRFYYCSCKRIYGRGVADVLSSICEFVSPQISILSIILFLIRFSQ